MSEPLNDPTMPDVLPTAEPTVARVFDIRSAGRPATVEPTSAEIRTAGSVLLERMQFLRQAGITFRGLRDLYEILGYQRVIMPADYRARYARGGIAARVIEAFPKATWRGEGELIEDHDPKKSTALEKAWHSLNKRLKVWASFYRVDIMAGQGRYAILLIGDGGELDQPLKKARAGNPDKILFLSVFSEEDAMILEWETDVKSPRFGLPTKYQLRRIGNSTAQFPGLGMPPFTSAAFNKPVDWTRVIHVAEGCLDNEVFGQPSLERVWNLLDDLDKVTGGGAEAFWLRANQGIQLDVDKDMTLANDEKAALKEQADEYQHQIRRMLRTRGVKVNTLGSDVANFSNPADAILTQIAGSKAIPKRILTGSEMGELASSQDRDNWKDQINGRQTGYAAPYIVRPFVDRLIEYGYLPAPAGDDPQCYDVEWPHIQVLTEQEKSLGAKDWATTATAEGPVFARDEIRDKWYGMEPWPKPVLDTATGEHTAPESGLAVDPKQDPETGLPFKAPPAPAVGAVGKDGLPLVDPVTGEPVQVDPKSGLPILDRPALVPRSPKVGAPGVVPAKVPPGKGKSPRAAEVIMDEALLLTLENAIRDQDTETIDKIIGIERNTE